MYFKEMLLYVMLWVGSVNLLLPFGLTVLSFAFWWSVILGTYVFPSNTHALFSLWIE